MDLNELKEYFQQGREIEFSLHGKPYFMGPKHRIPYQYYIYDETEKESVFCGIIEEVLAFSFPGGFTLGENLDEFTFEFIL